MNEFWDSVCDSIRESSPFFPQNPSVRSVGGGCINEAFLLESEGDPCAFVKVNAAEKLPMFEAEAEALSEIANTSTIRVPKPICSGESGGRSFLALEAIPMTSRSDTASQEKMGRQLAALHHITSANGHCGWHRHNTIGELPQRNPWMESWAGFFGKHRLGVQFEMASQSGRTFRKSDELMERLSGLLADHEPAPSLLHGDLWGGNASFDSHGEPVVYDPATYYGDRETDLAFTEMFGGFGPAFYDGYNDAWQLDSGYRRRKPLYNLYHVLNHYNHFGGGYAAQAETIIERLISD